MGELPALRKEVIAMLWFCGPSFHGVVFVFADFW